MEAFTNSMTVRQDGETVARHGQFELHSAFQPIYSYAHKRLVGYEGLVRACDPSGGEVSPGAVLGSVRSFDETVFLDRLLRALHVANFFARTGAESWIFLNVNPLVVIHGRKKGSFFQEMLLAFQMPAHRVVVEVTEAGTRDEDDLENAAEYYRDIGCLVAIDDFGAGHSNFNRIWNVKPDIIKLDRAMIQKAALDSGTGRSLTRIVGLLHEIGALVVAEGIETEQEALVAVNADVDLLQGFYFARPFSGSDPDLSCTTQFATLQDNFARHMHDEVAEFRHAIDPYRSAFMQAAGLLASGRSVEESARKMLAMPNVQRFFLLDEQGTQIGGNLTAPDYPQIPDSRHLPLSNAQGASWMHRPYFRRAMTTPGAIQVTRPYLSIADARMCLTLSLAIDIGAGRRVLCCDIEHRSPRH